MKKGLVALALTTAMVLPGCGIVGNYFSKPEEVVPVEALVPKSEPVVVDYFSHVNGIKIRAENETAANNYRWSLDHYAEALGRVGLNDSERYAFVNSVVRGDDFVSEEESFELVATAREAWDNMMLKKGKASLGVRAEMVPVPQIPSGVGVAQKK
jgi:hypothetical protein